MSRKAILRPEARRDLADIWRYTRQTWGPEQAFAYTADIRAAIERVANQPELGSDRGHIRDGLRKITVGSHAIYYFHDERTLRVSRIFHNRMDVKSAF